VLIKIVCLFLFNENEKYNFDEILEVKNDNNNLGKIERESVNVEKETNEKIDDINMTKKDS